MISLIVASLMGTTVGALVTGGLALIPINRLTQEMNRLRSEHATSAATAWDDPAFPMPAVLAPNTQRSALELLDQLERERERAERLKPPSPVQLCLAVYGYVAYDDDATLDQIDDLIDRGAPVSDHASPTWSVTPVIATVTGWREANRHVLRGSQDKRKLIVILDRLIAAGADARTIDDNGDTARMHLENQAQGHHNRHWRTEWTAIANEGIALLREAERAADRRDLESAAQGGASERTGITRRM